MGQYATNFANNFTVVYSGAQLEAGAGIDIKLNRNTATIQIKGVSDKVVFT